MLDKKKKNIVQNHATSPARIIFGKTNFRVKKQSIHYLYTLVLVLLSALVERLSVFCPQDFFYCVLEDPQKDKLDGVGPVYIRPSTDYINHFVFFKQFKKISSFFTCETWHVKCDTWHVTCDTWQVRGGEPSLKSSAPWLLRFESEGVLQIFPQRMNDSAN